MTNVVKRFTGFTNIHKMSNAWASSFGRYIKWLSEWYTMYEENFNFLFKSMFSRKNSGTDKNWDSFVAAPPEKKAPLIDQTLNISSAPTYHLKKKKKIRPTFNLKTEEAQKTKHSIVLGVSLHIPVYVCTVYTRLEVKNIHHGEKFLEITTRLLKMNFPACQFFLKTFPQKSRPQHLGNYADYSNGTYTCFGKYTNVRLYT